MIDLGEPFDLESVVWKVYSNYAAMPFENTAAHGEATLLGKAWRH
jgi:hypothetical protein